MHMHMHMHMCLHSLLFPPRCRRAARRAVPAQVSSRQCAKAIWARFMPLASHPLEWGARRHAFVLLPHRRPVMSSLREHSSILEIPHGAEFRYLTSGLIGKVRCEHGGFRARGVAS